MSVLGKIRAVLRSYNYVLFDRPYELNIVGIRSTSTVPNRFDDEIHVFFKTPQKNWEHYVFTATTDPGTYWLRNPMMPQGTAILAQGQYLNAYQIALHRGQYEALCQIKPVTTIRDYNRDAVLDFYNGYKTTGMYGINIHRASIYGETKYVDKYSAGCQVIEDPKDFELFMQLCERHRALYGNYFTYTLIDYRAMQRATRRRWAIGLSAGTALLALIIPLTVSYFSINKSLDHDNAEQPQTTQK